MRQGPGGRRPRGRHHGGGNGGSGGNGGNGGPSSSSMGSNRPRSAASLRHQTFDSNGPDVRVRGNAWQVHEKYQALARDAQSSGDRVLAENLLQHAEHYYRIIEAINEATASEQRQRGPAFGQQPDVPPNYYTADGQLAAPPQATVDGQQAPAEQAQPMAEAEVQRKAPASPFFTPDEAEEPADNSGLVAAQR